MLFKLLLIMDLMFLSSCTYYMVKKPRIADNLNLNKKYRIVSIGFYPLECSSVKELPPEHISDDAPPVDYSQDKKSLLKIAVPVEKIAYNGVDQDVSEEKISEFIKNYVENNPVIDETELSTLFIEGELGLKKIIKAKGYF